MQFRYKDSHGKVVPVHTVAALLRAIQDGTVTDTTPLAIGDDPQWRPAKSVTAYRDAVKALGPSVPATPAPTEAVGRPPRVPPRPRPTPRRSALRRGRVALGLGALALGAGVMLYAGRSAGPQDGLSPASTAAVRTANTALALAQLGREFGDSVAWYLRETKDRQAELDLERRFRGSALQSSGSLRAVQSAVRRMAADADSLLARAESQGRLLRARAGAMETSEDGVLGLAGAFEDLALEWRWDLERYVTLHKRAGSELNELAAFLLRQRQSFVLRDGQPAFLSREDATAYSQHWDRLVMAAGEEANWAREIERKRPGWLARLDDAQRPRFGQPLVQRPRR